MKLPRKFVLTAVAAALLSLPLGASVQGAESESSIARYVDGKGARFESLSGSHDNLESLVRGLRTSHDVTLVEQTPEGPRTITFDPPTRPMGYGSITKSLDLADRSLAAHGINDPTAAELKAALNGGTVRTSQGEEVRLRGVLRLRSHGLGWGQIAHRIGVDPSGHGRHFAHEHHHHHPGLHAEHEGSWRWWNHDPSDHQQARWWQHNAGDQGQRTRWWQHDAGGQDQSRSWQHNAGDQGQQARWWQHNTGDQGQQARWWQHNTSAGDQGRGQHNMGDHVAYRGHLYPRPQPSNMPPPGANPAPRVVTAAGAGNSNPIARPAPSGMVTAAGASPSVGSGRGAGAGNSSGTTRPASSGIVTAAGASPSVNGGRGGGAGNSSATSRAASSGIVTAAGTSASFGGGRGQTTALGKAGAPPATKIHTAMGPGSGSGNAFGRAGK